MSTNRRKADFSFILNNGIKVVGSTHVLFCAKTYNCNKISVGIIVSKKLGNAAKRNRIKRRLRAVVQNIFPENSPCYNYVIIGRKKTLYCPFNQLINDFRYSIRKLNALFN
ncbi:ribonuclease P [Rickettsiales bacterium Ac37b]|nr:ribonuclease P [Rickettsiales bacterium Ac37b]